VKHFLSYSAVTDRVHDLRLYRSSQGTGERTRNADIHTFTPRAGFRLAIPGYWRSKTVHGCCGLVKYNVCMYDGLKHRRPGIVRFEVLKAVRMTTLLFWVVAPWRLVGRYQRFRGTYCLHLQHWKSVFLTCYIRRADAVLMLFLFPSRETLCDILTVGLKFLFSSSPLLLPPRDLPISFKLHHILNWKYGTSWTTCLWLLAQRATC
jgi:hypothetical protein